MLRRSREDAPKNGENLKSSLIKITKSEVSTQKRFIIASIVDKDFIKTSIHNDETIRKILPNSISKTIYRFCSDYYKKYKTSVGININNIFSEDETIDDNVKCDIKQIICDISKQYSHSDFNWEYEFDCCSKWLDELYVNWYNLEVDALKGFKDFEGAKKLLTDYEDVNWYGETNEFDPFSDELIEEALKASTDNLFEMPSSFNRFFGKQTFQLGSFVMILGPAKSGKSFTLNLFHQFATLAGLNTMKVECGDLGQVDVTSRMIKEAGRTPIDKKEYGERRIPCVDCVNNQNGTCNVATNHSLFVSDADGNSIKVEPEDVSSSYVPCDRCSRDPEFANKIRREFIGTTWWKTEEFGTIGDDGEYEELTIDKVKASVRLHNRIRKGHNSYYSFDADMCCPQDLDDLIVKEESDGNKPHVILVDYFGLMKCNPEYERLNDYKQTTSIATCLRNISKNRKVCLIVLDQTSIDTASKPIMDRMVFSDNKKKFDNVTSAYCISKLAEDAEIGNSRMQQLLNRTEPTRNEQLVLLQDIGTGNLNLGNYVQKVDDLIEHHPAFHSLKKEKDAEENKNNGRKSD